MIASLFLCLLAGPRDLPSSVPAGVLSASDDHELDAKIAAAGKDVPKLLALAASYLGGPQNDWATKVYNKVLELDPNNEAAHKALHHQLYDKKWFESFAELTKYKREEAARMKEKGLARYKDEWVPEADAPFMNMGWVKDENGVFVHPSDAARRKQVAEWQAAGYKFRADDNSWIAPGDSEKWAAIQWKCGDQWLDMAKADEYHSKIGQWWEIAGEHFTVWTTCEWAGGNAARWYADKLYPELVRIFGVEPKGSPHFIVLNSLDQYNQASGGQPPLIPESEGVSSLHGAYFADLFIDAKVRPPRFLGAGVSYWDRKDAKAAGWGPYFLRWAAAQSYVEAIDPSWTTIGDNIASGGAPDPGSVAGAFWGEKKIPRWLRYGAASYAERFLKDPEAAAGADPWTLRAFAFSELKKSGDLHKLDDIFAFKLDINDAGSGRLYQEAGLLVSFLIDGAPENKEPMQKLEAFKSALKSGSKATVTQAAGELQKELAKCEPAIRKYAGL